MFKVAILGTRGIPSTYSGFETSVQETATRFVRRGYTVTVYCRRNHYKEYPLTYQGVYLKYLPSWRNKFFDTLTHTFLSILHLYLHTVDIIILYGLVNSIYIPLLRVKNVPIIAVVDGADWERQKWGYLARSFLKLSRIFAVIFADSYIVDNKYVASKYEICFKKKPLYIPYGADYNYEYKPEVLKRYGLEKKGYIIFVGRFVREKGIELLLEAYREVKTTKKLVLVGGNDVDIEYESKLRSFHDQRVLFTGFVYGNDYFTLLQDALFYVSASYVEGTSPSLLAAMAINGYALVSNIPENIEVLRGCCNTFNRGDKEDLVKKLQQLINDEKLVDIEREKTKKIVKQYYSWDTITDQYEKLIQELLCKKVKKRTYFFLSF